MIVFERNGLYIILRVLKTLCLFLTSVNFLVWDYKRLIQLIIVRFLRRAFKFEAVLPWRFLTPRLSFARVLGWTLLRSRSCFLLSVESFLTLLILAKINHNFTSFLFFFENELCSFPRRTIAGLEILDSQVLFFLLKCLKLICKFVNTNLSFGVGRMLFARFFSL